MSNDFSIIGKPTAMVDAAGKTTGAGKYTDDLSLPGMLIGKILHSPYPHARINRIDTSRAEKLEEEIRNPCPGISDQIERTRQACGVE